jgi:hypothetical protein
VRGALPANKIKVQRGKVAIRVSIKNPTPKAAPATRKVKQPALSVTKAMRLTLKLLEGDFSSVFFSIADLSKMI